MSLNKTTTATGIVSAIQAINPGLDGTQAQALWEAIINALYVRIKADLVVGSVVATSIPVATTGTAAAQTGATTSTGTATSNSVT